MRIGSSIALIAIGLVLALAVDFDIEGLDVQQIGWILTVVGVVGLIVSVVLMQRAGPVVSREVEPVVREPVVREPVVRDERYPGPGPR